MLVERYPYRSDIKAFLTRLRNAVMQITYPKLHFQKAKMPQAEAK